MLLKLSLLGWEFFSPFDFFFFFSSGAAGTCGECSWITFFFFPFLSFGADKSYTWFAFLIFYCFAYLSLKQIRFSHHQCLPQCLERSSADDISFTSRWVSSVWKPHSMTMWMSASLTYCSSSCVLVLECEMAI